MSNRRASGLKVFGGFEGFIISVKTDNTGASNNDQFTLPLYSAQSYLYDLTTSDGQSFNRSLSSDFTITFPSAGTYDIFIKGTFPGIDFNGGGDANKLVDIKQWGNIQWGLVDNAYRGCTSLTVVTAIDIPDFSNLLTGEFSAMFLGCTNLSYVDVSQWDMSNATSLQNFGNLSVLLDTDFGNWDISNVRNVDDFMRFTGSALSTANYDLLLIGWEASLQAVYPNGVGYPTTSSDFWVGLQTYYTSNGLAETARQSLITNYGWNVNDGGAIADSLPLIDIISEYKFENNVLDFVGSNNGTPTDITYAAGLVGQTGVFNGSSSSVDTGTKTLVGGKSVFSWSCLFKMDVAASTNSMYGSFGSSNSQRSILIRQSTNVLQAFLYTTSQVGGTFFSFTDTTSWHHMVFTYNGSTMKMYLDGILSPTTFSQTGAVQISTLNNETIGSERAAFFDGNMDCVTIWDVELSEGEARLLAIKELNGIDINP